MDSGNTGKQPVPWQEGTPVHPQDQALAQPVPPGYGPYYEEEEIDLREYLAVILRRRWTVLAILLLVIFTTAFFTFRMKPLYKATATLEISPNQPQVVPFGDDGRVRVIEQARYIQSQVEILKSRTLARRVVEALDLEHNPEFQAKKRGYVSKLVGGLKGAVTFLLGGGKKGVETLPVDPQEAKKDALVSAFLGRLKVSPLKGGKSYLMAVSFEAHDPKLAAKVVNTLVEEYIAFDLEKRVEATKVGKQYLEKQIARVQARLEEAEERLNRFARENDIVFLSQLGKGEGQGEDIATTRLNELTNELIKAEAHRIKLESLYRQSLKDPDSIPQVMNNPLVSSLKSRLAQLETRYANLSSTFTPEYPEMKRLREEMASVNSQITREKKRVIASIKTDYLTALKREEMIRSALEKQKKKTTELRQKAIDYNILKREVETNRRIYELLLQRSKEMDVEASVRSTSIRPIDRASIPLFPYKPKKALNLLLSLIVGLMAGVFLAFFLEYLDNTIKTPDEVEKLLRLPVLGVVPSITLKKRRKDEKTEGTLIDFYAVNSPKSPAAEAFRMVRTSLMLAAAGQPPKTVLVTSPQVGGGKTLVALNLAVAYAQMESRVLLVDCDLRRARLHRVLEVKANPGLSNYLAGRVDLGQVVHQVDGILGDGVTVDFIPAGTVPPNPVELLNSKSFVHLLELLREKYDHIVMDSPPLVGFADALVLSRLVDGTILVLRNQQTPKPAAKYARDRLIQVGGNILGVVVNDVKVERGAYYYGKYSGYYYYYSRYYSYGSSPELPDGK